MPCRRPRPRPTSFRSRAFPERGPWTTTSSRCRFLPLYWFGKGGTDVVNYSLSLGKAPKFSNGGKTVTISLRHFEWSDGQPVTSRDVEFWMNELDANQDDWYGTVPGEFPSNVVSQSYPNNYTVVFTFNRRYNPLWLLNNELSQITPLPQQSWDKTSASGSVGNYDTTTSGAVAVYKYLNAQSTDIGTYQTNPLWQVVDGPWRLKSFDTTTQYTVLVPNKQYSGSPKPTLSALDEVPFTSDAAEMDALRSGELDYGYLSPSEYSQVGYYKARGYKVVAWPLWATAYAVYNFTNPTAGPIMKQLYVRQAIQALVDQPQDVKDVWHGYAVPTYGPVPISPKSPYFSPSEKNSSYSFSVSHASKLLTEHGWKTGSSGVASCQRAGSSSSECGAGISKGAQLSLKFVYTSGNTGFTEEIESLQSDASRVGIKLNLSEAPFDTVETDAAPRHRSRRQRRRLQQSRVQSANRGRDRRHWGPACDQGGRVLCPRPAGDLDAGVRLPGVGDQGQPAWDSAPGPGRQHLSVPVAARVRSWP